MKKALKLSISLFIVIISLSLFACKRDNHDDLNTTDNKINENQNDLDSNETNDDKVKNNNTETSDDIENKMNSYEKATDLGY